MPFTKVSKPNSKGYTYRQSSNDFVPTENVIGRVWGWDLKTSEPQCLKVILRENSTVRVGDYIGDDGTYSNKIVGMTVRNKNKESYRPRKTMTDWNLILYLEKEINRNVEKIGYIYPEGHQPKPLPEFRIGRSSNI